MALVHQMLVVGDDQPIPPLLDARLRPVPQQEIVPRVPVPRHVQRVRALDPPRVGPHRLRLQPEREDGRPPRDPPDRGGRRRRQRLGRLVAVDFEPLRPRETEPEAPQPLHGQPLQERVDDRHPARRGAPSDVGGHVGRPVRQAQRGVQRARVEEHARLPAGLLRGSRLLRGGRSARVAPQARRPLLGERRGRGVGLRRLGKRGGVGEVKGGVGERKGGVGEVRGGVDLLKRWIEGCGAGGCGVQRIDAEGGLLEAWGGSEGRGGGG